MNIPIVSSATYVEPLKLVQTIPWQKNREKRLRSCKNRVKVDLKRQKAFGVRELKSPRESKREIVKLRAYGN